MYTFSSTTSLYSEAMFRVSLTGWLGARIQQKPENNLLTHSFEYYVSCFSSGQHYRRVGSLLVLLFLINKRNSPYHRCDVQLHWTIWAFQSQTHLLLLGLCLCRVWTLKQEVRWSKCTFILNISNEFNLHWSREKCTGRNRNHWTSLLKWTGSTKSIVR